MSWNKSKQLKLEDLRYQVQLLEQEKEDVGRKRAEQVFHLFGSYEVTCKEIQTRRHELAKLLQTWEREDGA